MILDACSFVFFFLFFLVSKILKKKPERYAEIPYCYLILGKFNFAKMKQAYFAGLSFRDLAKNTLKR